MGGPTTALAGPPELELLYSPASPFARKIRVLIRERDALELFEETVEMPLDDGAGLRAVNPLGKVPTLLRAGAAPLYDSPLITEYLDQTLPGTNSLPGSGEKRWMVLRQQALADGILDAGLALTFERLRPEAERSTMWMARWAHAIDAALDEVAATAPDLPAIPDLGAIAVACALGYLDFRHPGVAWRAKSARLAQWYDTMAARPSMLATAPA
jgi:glutathione S-transferase